MSFWGPEDHLLIMNLPGWQKRPKQCVELNDAELKRLKDVGCTAIINYAHWYRKWEDSDRFVAQAERAGLKSVLATPMRPGTGMPDYCYGHSRQGSPMRSILSIWSREVKHRLISHFEEAKERYPNTLVVYHGYLSGESVLHNAPSFYEPAAIASYQNLHPRQRPHIKKPETVEWLRQSVVDHYIEIDEALVDQGSLWNALQWRIAQQSMANGNFAQEDILRAESERWPGVEQILLQYTHFSHPEPYVNLINKWMNEFDLTVIVEAQYCAGLKRTTPIAIERGFHGQIVCPLHPWAKVKRVTKEQLDQIEASKKLWTHS